MLSATEALATVLRHVKTFPAETVSTEQAAGRILQQSIRAERDQPPFDRVMMDGIAIAFDDFDGGLRCFPIQATQTAGEAAHHLQPRCCLEIMTGAMLPVGANCIIPVERIVVRDGVATIDEDYAAKPDQFIHSRGSDFLQGEELLSPGKRISALDIAVIASCGETRVSVADDPVVRVVSTGNELVAAGKPILDHQIRSSNGQSIASLLGQYSLRRCELDHVADDIEQIAEALRQHLAEARILILSGGVSMGKADFVPQVLEAIGVKQVFHKVSQRPGKPLWFGIGADDQLVFALPGNPVSALICCRQYVIPALLKASGLLDPPPQFAALASNVSFKPSLTCFQPVKLISNAAGTLLALPVKTNTSGDFHALSATDGYIELPSDASHFDSGSVFTLHRWIAA